MPDFVDGTIAEIDKRLVELKDEESKLNAARAALLGQSNDASRAAAPRAARTGTGRRPGRPRGSRSRSGTRADQAVALIRENSGITIPQLAEKLKIQPNYLYRVVPKLVDAGLITKDGAALTAVEAKS